MISFLLRHFASYTFHFSFARQRAKVCLLSSIFYPLTSLIDKETIISQSFFKIFIIACSIVLLRIFFILFDLVASEGCLIRQTKSVFLLLSFN